MGGSYIWEAETRQISSHPCVASQICFLDLTAPPTLQYSSSAVSSLGHSTKYCMVHQCAMQVISCHLNASCNAPLAIKSIPTNKSKANVSPPLCPQSWKWLQWWGGGVVCMVLWGNVRWLHGWTSPDWNRFTDILNWGRGYTCVVDHGCSKSPSFNLWYL